jgi:serine protease Do
MMHPALKRWMIAGAVFGAGALTVVGGNTLLLNSAHLALAQDVDEARDLLQNDRDMAGVVQLSNVFRTVSVAVEPSVVDITVGRTVDGRQGRMRSMGNGSGVILDVEGNRGIILTNNHVIDNANRVNITLYDGRELPGTVVAADPKTDLAVVEITARRLVPARWGDSEVLGKGDWVLAFGSPFGYVGSMTAGIVSATGRSTADALGGRGPGILGPNGYEQFIQTDAAINPGNSGGPLVNLRGEVVGINSAIASRSGGFDGIGFAIPSELARRVYEQLRDDGRVRRGWLGVGIRDAGDVEVRARLDLPGELTGVLVTEVYRNGPTGDVLQPGDVVLAVEGVETATSRELRFEIADLPPGEPVELTIWRRGEVREVEVNLGEQPDNLLSLSQPRPFDPARAAIRPRDLGISITDTRDRDGVRITGLTRNTSAAASGLLPNDVILELDGRDIDDAEEFVEFLNAADLERGARLIVENREGQRVVILRHRASR